MVSNKGQVLYFHLMNNTIETSDQDGRHWPLKRWVKTTQHGCVVQDRSTTPAARRKVMVGEGEVP